MVRSSVSKIAVSTQTRPRRCAAFLSLLARIFDFLFARGIGLGCTRPLSKIHWFMSPRMVPR